MVAKVSGMVHVREDTTPLELEWNAIDQLKNIKIPLSSIVKLQASPETSPKMILKLVYTDTEGSEQSLVLRFTNRPTMNNIKEALLTIVARQRTYTTPEPSASNTPAPDGTTASAALSGSGSTSKTVDQIIDVNDPNALLNASLLKNHQLQQKILLEDKNLRNIFTQAVMKFKLSPSVFWLSRLNQLRTYALTFTQHRGPYNVLSTIRPVATSDNKVNVNVTRDTINEIFDTYPIVKKAFKDLVPDKLSEGEFWSRFFNSKLFRRLRGDKINNTNERGDAVLDKYMYIDLDYQDDGTKRQKLEANVSKFLDLEGNEQDNALKLGNRPDFTMRYGTEETQVEEQQGNENEMMILIKNMNKLSSKMVNFNPEDELSHTSKQDELSTDEQKEYEEELNLHDLNETEELQYIKLSLSTERDPDKHIEVKSSLVSPKDLSSFFSGNEFLEGVNLTETYITKKEEIQKTASEVSALIKHNFRASRAMSAQSRESEGEKLLSDSRIQEVITLNITAMEFLLHFWKLFLDGNNPNQLKKIFQSLRVCKSSVNDLQLSFTEELMKHRLIEPNSKLKEKVAKDLEGCFQPLHLTIDKACDTYMKALEEAQNQEKNSEGKRPLEV